MFEKSLHPPYPLQSIDLGMQLVPSAQANWSEVQGGREGEERVDDALCLLSKGTVTTASAGGDTEF